MSGVTYNHFGNRVKKSYLVDITPDGNIKRIVFNTNTSDPREVNRVHTNQDKVIWKASATEMENNSDTHCFG